MTCFLQRTAPIQRRIKLGRRNLNTYVSFCNNFHLSVFSFDFVINFWNCKGTLWTLCACRSRFFVSLFVSENKIIVMCKIQLTGTCSFVNLGRLNFRLNIKRAGLQYDLETVAHLMHARISFLRSRVAQPR